MRFSPRCSASQLSGSASPIPLGTRTATAASSWDGRSTAPWSRSAAAMVRRTRRGARDYAVGVFHLLASPRRPRHHSAMPQGRFLNGHARMIRLPVVRPKATLGAASRMQASAAGPLLLRTGRCHVCWCRHCWMASIDPAMSPAQRYPAAERRAHRDFAPPDQAFAPNPVSAALQSEHAVHAPCSE